MTHLLQSLDVLATIETFIPLVEPGEETQPKDSEHEYIKLAFGGDFKRKPGMNNLSTEQWRQYVCCF